MFKTPWGVVLVLVLLIMLVEFLIMSVIHGPFIDTHISIFYQNLIDAVLLTLIISPVLYSLVFKRLKSDELLRQINTSAQEAIVIVDEQDRITDWNPAAQRKFQYTREEAIGKQAHLLLAPSHYHTDAQRGFANFQKTGKGPLIGILNEVTAIRKDGSEFPVELSVTAFEVKGSWQAVGVMRDISERQRAKETLRKSEEKFSTIFESNPAMIAIGTTEGTIVDVNRSYADFLGYTRQEIMGKSWVDLGAISEDEFQKLLVLGLSAGDSLRNVEVTLRTRDGNLVHALLSAEYVSLDGTPYRLATLQDITARKQAENDLAASEALLKEFIQHTPAAIAMLDTQMRYIQTSERWIQDYHLSGQNIIGKSHYEIFPDAPQRWKDIHQRVQAGATEHCDEDPFPRADGSTEWLQWEARPWRKAGGEIGGIVFFTQVITERKRIEEGFRASEIEFRTLAESMPQIVWITRADGWGTYINQHWMDYTGLTLEESLGHGWNKPFHPDDQQQAWDAWQNATRDLATYSIESRLRRADGEYRWWLMRGVPLLDADGNILKWFGTCTDIHDLKMAELEIARANGELRESERRFSDLLGNVELISMMLDREARITYCNDYLLRLTGWKREEVIGKNWWDLFVPPEIQGLRNEFFTSLIDNQSGGLHHENEILTRSGERRLIRWNNSVLRSIEGEVIGTASIGEDITERNKLALLLEEKETRLRTLVNAIPDLIWLKDVEGIYQSCNPMFERFFGAREADIVGKSDFDFVDRELATSFREHDRIAMAAKDSCINEEWVVFADDGHRALLETVKTPMRDAGGKLAGVLGIARDITARKKLEQDKEQYLKFFVLSINPMCIADPYGCFTQVNPAFSKLTGYSESELIAKPFLDFVLADDRQKTADEMTQQVESRPTLYFDNRYQCKDGSVIDLSWTAYYDKHDGITYATAIDTTERKRTEESLRKLSLAVEQSPSAIDITDLDANIEYVNEAFARTSGYSVAELIGQNPRLLQSGKTPKKNYEEMWAHLTRGEIWKGEFINRRKDGSEYIESALVSPVRQADGRVTHYLAIKEDITQLKQAQKAVRDSNESLHRMLNSMAEGAYGVDSNGDCTFVNRAFLKMLGYQNEAEVMGKHLHNLIHHSRADGSSYPEDECKAYRAYRVNQPINVSDEVFWRKDGVAIPIEYWSHPIESDGVTIGAIVTFIDITERKRAENTLRESDVRYRGIFEHAYDIIYLLEPDGTFRSLNNAFERITGWATEEWIGKPFGQIVHPDDLPFANDIFLKVLGGEATTSFRLRIAKKSGEYFDADSSISPLGDNGVTGGLGILRDITERKLNEAKLAEQLDELRRWHDVTSGREGRILDLKHEVNELLGQTGKDPRYPSAESENPSETNL